MDARSDRITLDNMLVLAFVGAGAAERRVAQQLRIDVELAVEMSGARSDDALDGTIDYAQLYARLHRAAAESPAALLEHVAQRLLDAMLDLPGLHSARVRIAKPGLFSGATPAVEVAGMPYRRTAVGLGANLGDAPASIAAARDALRAFGTIEATSSLYRTRPWGVADQPMFYNAAVLLRTAYLPEVLLSGLKRIEADLGRLPGPRYGPRVIDCDFLDDAAGSFTAANLILPHPRLFERGFALGPLCEIDASYRPAFDALSEDERAGVERLSAWPPPVFDAEG